MLFRSPLPAFSQGSPERARAALLAQLSAVMGGALAAGDLDGARVVNEAIGKLLLAAVQLERPETDDARALQTPDGSGPASGAAVVDLDARRRERAG